MARREPLPLAVLAAVASTDEATLRQRLARLGSLFPIRLLAVAGRAQECVAPAHNSIVEWLTAVDETTRLPSAGVFAASAVRGARRLADACWALYQQGPARMPLYACSHLVAHLVETSQWEKAGQVLCDLTYLETKCERLGADEVLGDFRRVLPADPSAANG
ncbi:MAG: hypothetical protein HY814_11330, partial [Candidatus Riflebacteria bacterium]|nr:hypothetical protein [Candidatus Riflebacteria bacterium]